MNQVISTAVKPRYTPEDLLAMPDGDSYELVDGKLVERHMGARSSWVSGRVYRLLSNLCEENPLGWVWPADNGYQCFPGSPNLVRKPDVSFIRLGRLPGEELPEGFVRLAPDLAVEVISPNDLYHEVEQKVHEYLHASVRLVWVINPHLNKVRVHRADGTVTDLHATDELSGEDVVPGFRCRVGELFVVPARAANPHEENP
jgi:Uma2 family endonuclease